MAKWADYLISGVWKVNNEITNVVLHTDSDDSVGRGSKASEAHVISLIERGFTVKTMRWNYSSASWNVGASVIVVQGQYRKFLRTVADAQTSDNLDNMLPMGSLT